MGKIVSNERWELIEHWSRMWFSYWKENDMFGAEWSSGYYLDPPEGEGYSREEVAEWLNEIPKMAQELLTLRQQNAELHQEIREQISAYDNINEKQGEILERNDELKEQNRLLIEMCDRLAEWLENVHIDYSNGNVAPNGMDEGDVLGWKGHKEMIEAYTVLMTRIKGE